MKVVLNSDRSVVESIRKQLKENDGYCPCRLSKNEDTKCMCKELRDKMERNESGTCHCGLYVVIKDE